MADFVFETAGGLSVGLEGGMKGVAGERCVASTLPEKRECRLEKEPLFEGASASAIDGLGGRFDVRCCGNSVDSSVACCSSSTASSSTMIAGTTSVTASLRVKPLYQKHCPSSTISATV